MDAFGKIISMILAIILLFIFPSLYIAQKQDSIIQSYVLTETSNFVDKIKNTGEITKATYEDFTSTLNATGNIYNVELEHGHYEVIPDEDSFYQYYYTTYELEILNTLYPENGDSPIYTLNKGDYISVKVTNKNKTLATKIQEILYNRVLPTEQIFVMYGGIIRDENN